jgi:hypothetical protein
VVTEEAYSLLALDDAVANERKALIELCGLALE